MNQITTWRHNRIIGDGFIILVAIIMPFTAAGNGWDFFQHYRPDALNGTYGQGSWLPYYGYWLIMPFAWLPGRFGYLAWLLFNAVGFIIACRYWRASSLTLALSIPLIFSFSQGQIEGVLALGVALSLQPTLLLAGAGLVILSIKPQIGLLIALHVIYTRFDWKLFVVPLLVFGLSLLQWGWWLDDWLQSLNQAGDGIINTTRNVSLWPWSLLLLPLIWVFRRRPKILLWLTSLIAAYYAFYSWAVPFSSGIPVKANILAWLLTIAMIVVALIWQIPFLPPWWLVPAYMIYREVKGANEPRFT